MTVDEMKHQAMLLTKPKMITVECRIGTERIKPNQGIKAYICDGEVIWQNPDYPDVDYPKATKKNKGLVQMARSLFGSPKTDMSKPDCISEDKWIEVLNYD